MDNIKKRAHGIDVDASDHGSFFGVGFGDNHARDFSPASLDGDGERTADSADAAVEGKLPDEDAITDILLGEATVGADDTEGHRQVESGSFFLNVGGSEIDGDMRGRNVVSAVFEGGANAVAALADGGVGEADGVEVILITLDAGAVDLHLNNVGVDAVDRGAESFVEHE